MSNHSLILQIEDEVNGLFCIDQPISSYNELSIGDELANSSYLIQDYLSVCVSKVEGIVGLKKRRFQFWKNDKKVKNLLVNWLNEEKLSLNIYKNRVEKNIIDINIRMQNLKIQINEKNNIEQKYLVTLAKIKESRYLSQRKKEELLDRVQSKQNEFRIRLIVAEQTLVQFGLVRSNFESSLTRIDKMLMELLPTLELNLLLDHQKALVQLANELHKLNKD